jgi:hypothetical protein
LARALLNSLARLTTEKPVEWRARLHAMPPEIPDAEGVPTPDGFPLEEVPFARSEPITARALKMNVVDEALRLAVLTAEDKRQRAVDAMASSLEELQEWRLAVREVLADSAGDAGLNHVMAWLWQESSTGQPLTEAARQVGYELCLSWYKTALYT